jgi:hypothetical protein
MSFDIFSDESVLSMLGFRFIFILGGLHTTQVTLSQQIIPFFSISYHISLFRRITYIK